MMDVLAAEAAASKTVMIVASYLKTHHTATSLRSKGEPGDQRGRPIRFFMTAGQVSDYTGAVALLDGLPKADWLLADRDSGADWFGEALKDKGKNPASRARSRAASPSSTTSAATGSRSSSGV